MIRKKAKTPKVKTGSRRMPVEAPAELVEITPEMLASVTNARNQGYTNDEHREHCRVAGCKHPAVSAASVQQWCTKCRRVAAKGQN